MARVSPNAWSTCELEFELSNGSKRSRWKHTWPISPRKVPWKGISRWPSSAVPTSAARTVAIKGLKRPNKRRDVFLSLAEGGYLESDYAAVMSDMVGLRNRLVHLYMVIEPKKMYQYLQEDIVHFETFEAFAVALLEQEISRKD